ncbi:hypothetical protein KIN20_025535 [Parelaphostrongylus tenuis]|uniref:Peptidase M12A domain-containing protein n=1 Tax=Parelaphostrongylus tenuis TaxID=148309 RepID=A0AAD5MVC6_PARTN|nr:hypothetical protein KIN20_025535 [Parelaphostrongylus tenuis]
MIPSAHSTVYNVPYDYYSLMHYGKAMFAQPGKITIETLDSRYTDIIGTQTDASAGDYYKVCNIYNCATCKDRLKITHDEVKDISNPRPTSDSMTSTDRECSNTQPILCGLLKKAGFLDCDYEYTNKMCCASCNAATPKDSGGPDMS